MRSYLPRRTQMTPTKVEWYSKEEAGVRLGSPERPLSPRRILDLAKEGKLESEKFKDPKTNQMTVRIRAGSVERFLTEKDAPSENRTQNRTNGQLTDTKPDTKPDKRTLDGHPTDSKRQGNGHSTDIGVMELVRGLREGFAAHPARLWLTLQEAVEYSGLPAGTLLEFLHSGRLPALDVGRRRRGGRWRIRQVDLRQLNAIPLEAHYKVLAQSQQV
jgi:excisionase family DNA binding protein